MSAGDILSVLSAASNGDLTTLKTLGETLNLSECCDKFGASAVHYAVRGGKIECLRWLILTAGLSGNKPAHNGATPVHDAAATGQLDCLQWLVQNGVCVPNAKDSTGTTPLHLGGWGSLVRSSLTAFLQLQDLIIYPLLYGWSNQSIAVCRKRLKTVSVLST